MVLDESHRIHALVNPIIDVPGEEMDAYVQTHFCIQSFDLDGNLLKEYLFPLESWPDRPREIACSGNYLYATNGLTIWKINLSDEHLESIPVRHLLPWDIGRTTDIKCDQNGRILFSSRVQNESDSVRSEIYRYDEHSGEFEKVLESMEYQKIETGCCQQPSMFFDENGLLYLVTSLVGSLEVFNPELDNIFSLDEPPIGDYGYPAWDVAAFDGYVYVLGFMDVHVFRWE
jgi:sugar lactone lactonase YvrE